MKLLKKIFLLTIFTASFTMATHTANKEVETGKLWVAVAYGAAEQGQSNELIAGLGVGGVLQAGLYGAAIGGPIGAGVGIAIGL